ncbi:MAG TPA: transporter substrate-binding domain-containing protein [Cellvibrio sp.]|nr:transporter substrate-binding domain-containing protein [Cellvibrio sp.]
MAKPPAVFLTILQRMALVVVCSLSALSVAEPLRVVITGDGNSNSQDPSYFFEQLLVLSLDKTRLTDGDYTLGHNTHGGGIARDRAMIVAGVGIDVMWASVTREREEQMRVVPIDLLKNLNNFRVLLVNKGAQPLFSQVQTLNDLRKFTVGSGEHWTDGYIMKDNGFNVMATSSYYGLFKMLAARRFHFISRGLHEIGYDANAYKEFGLVKEEKLLLTYDVPIPYCFFVNKNNIKLADRIDRGLKIAIQDGSFDKLFYQMPSFKEGEDILKSANRTLITIKNTKK